MNKQSHLFNWIPKEKTNFFERMKKDGVLKIALQEVKKCCDQNIKDYWDNVKYKEEEYKIRSLSDPSYKPIRTPEEYSIRPPEFVYRLMTQSIEYHFPSCFIDECIEHGVLVKDDTFGLVFKEVSD